jgi:hypothetical protein
MVKGREISSDQEGEKGGVETERHVRERGGGRK